MVHSLWQVIDNSKLFAYLIIPSKLEQSILVMSKLGGKVIAAFATFIAVLTYLAIGAAIFQAIEQEHEIEQREEYDQQLNLLLDKVVFGFWDS